MDLSYPRDHTVQVPYEENAPWPRPMHVDASTVQKKALAIGLCNWTRTMEKKKILYIAAYPDVGPQPPLAHSALRAH